MVFFRRQLSFPIIKRIFSYCQNSDNPNNSQSQLDSGTVNSGLMDTNYHGSKGDEDLLNTHGNIHLTRNRRSVTCSKIISGEDKIDEALVTERNNFLISHILQDKAFQKIANNCTKFKQDRGYFHKPVTIEEKEFPLAFGIYMYKSVFQVEQLLRTIYRPQNIYCIHVDRKAPAVIHRAVQTITKCFDNVFIASRLAKVTWCSIEVVRAELYCLSDLLKRSSKWKYYLNLSGQEFPLKTNLEIVQILKEFQGNNDIMSASFSHVSPERQHFRYFVSRGIIENTTIPKTEPKPFEGPIFKGELHVALIRQYVEFILHSKTGQAWFTWLNDTLCPDEYFYQTLSRLPDVPGGPGLWNKSDQVHGIVRAKIWHGPCSGRIVRHICVYGWKDLPKLVNKPQLFANKFHADFDSVTLECLEELINNRTNNPIRLNLPFFKNFSTFKSWNSITRRADWFLEIK
ncbi:beta-1,3-galactosyl-O-glycosyl-glycoprotein beta-1,6-N-acetylglucosaminyltransferase-like [Glandiceps talaboti]